MISSNRPAFTTQRRGHPTLLLALSCPVACFVGALASDITYASTADMMWADFSAWLLAAAMATAALAIIVWGVSLALRRGGRTGWPAWPVVGGAVLVLILGLLDNLVHSRDAWTSVVPTGLALSVLTVFVMLATIWFGSASVRS